MARKGNGGSGGATATLLEAILEANNRTNAALEKLNGEVIKLRNEVAHLHAEVDLLRSDMNKAIDRLAARVDNILQGPIGDSVRRHDREIADLRDKFEVLVARERGG